MNSEPAFKDVSYIVQYSASYGVMGNTKLSAHVFMMLSAKVSATTLKAWLIDRNLLNVKLRAGITLTKTAAALHWPLDVTACQNDKLLYIAPPDLRKGVTCTIKPAERIQYIAGSHLTLDVKHIKPTRSIEVLKGKPVIFATISALKRGSNPYEPAPNGSDQSKSRPSPVKPRSRVSVKTVVLYISISMVATHGLITILSETSNSFEISRMNPVTSLVNWYRTITETRSPRPKQPRDNLQRVVNQFLHSVTSGQPHIGTAPGTQLLRS